MIHGKEDIQVDGPALQEQLEQTFGKEHFSVKIVDGAGHGVHLDEAQQVVDAILAFVK
jgi:pimeloyl-ACP methyl ester carboxylesterase